MIQNKPYEFMTRYTPQREWIEDHGMLLWVSTFFVEIGAAAFFVASFFNNIAAMFIGLLICAVIGGSLHVLELGRPLRIWRILFSSGFKTSWISRGMWSVSLFIGFGALYLGLAVTFEKIPALLFAANFFAFFAMIYLGFLLSYVNGLALWNSALMPILILSISIWGGLDILGITSMVTGTVTDKAVLLSRIFPLVISFIVICYLVGIRYQGESGRLSFKEIVFKKGAPVFWIGFVFLGVAFPVVINLGHVLSGNMPSEIRSVIPVFELAANLSLRYCILKWAIYEPIIPHEDYSTQFERG